MVSGWFGDHKEAQRPKKEIVQWYDFLYNSNRDVHYHPVLLAVAFKMHMLYSSNPWVTGLPTTSCLGGAMSLLMEGPLGHPASRFSPLCKKEQLCNKTRAMELACRMNRDFFAFQSFCTELGLFLLGLHSSLRQGYLGRCPFCVIRR